VFQFVQNQLEASAKYAAGVATAAFELSQEFQTELAELAENQFEAKHAEVNQLIAETLKKAPQGSEAAVAAVKQAVEAGNKAVAQARTAAKKSAELAKQGLEQLKANAPKAAKPARRRA
jgi:DNA-binding GntR family transcriptional regulator